MDLMGSGGKSREKQFKNLWYFLEAALEHPYKTVFGRFSSHSAILGSSRTFSYSAVRRGKFFKAAGTAGSPFPV